MLQDGYVAKCSICICGFSIIIITINVLNYATTCINNTAIMSSLL